MTQLSVRIHTAEYNFTPEPLENRDPNVALSTRLVSVPGAEDLPHVPLELA